MTTTTQIKQSLSNRGRIKMYITLFLSVNCVFTAISASRILAVFPVPSISHQVVFRPLIQELVNRGHEVVVITPDPAFPKGKTPANLTEIDVHDESYKIWRDTFIKTDEETKGNHLVQIEIILSAFNGIVEEHFKNDLIKRLIKEKKDYFDLVFIEACVRPALGYSHVFKTPVIFISSLGALYGNYESVGAPMHPFLYPYTLRQRLYNLSLWEKIKELYLLYLIDRIYQKFEPKTNGMLKKYLGEDTPSIDQLHDNVHMLFLNVNPVFKGIRPVPPSVVYMGGIHQNAVKQLPAELQSHLDSSKNGVIYISFGTNVDSSTLPTEKIKAIVKVLSKLPYDVLWKWDADILPGRTENIRIAKWWPQSDLLRHSNIKLFITQGGLQSTDEAITAGVPLIGIPLLADQWYNIENYVRHRIGQKINLEELTEVIFEDAVNTVITDESYRQNVVKLRSLMEDQPQRPLERAVWWTEHLLRHGGARHLRAPAANITWAEYLELELVLTALSVLLIIFLVMITILYCLWRCISQSTAVKVKSC